MLKKLAIIFIFLFIFTVSADKANAQYSCSGSIRCVRQNDNGTCSTVQNSSMQCESANTSSACTAIEANTCDEENECTLGACSWGGSGSTGSSCPAECRQGSSCPTGFQGASGCSSCSTNQVCCRANSCTGGGGTQVYPVGQFEYAGCDNFSGWALDANDFSQEVEVEILKMSGVQSLGWARTNVYRPDVNTAGNHGFSIPVPNAWKTGAQVQVRARVRDLTNSAVVIDLPGSDKYITCSPPPVCSATPPTNLVVTPLDADSARINWTPGSGGTSQLYRVGTNQAEVNAGCYGTTGGTPCVASGSLSSSANTLTVNNLVPDTFYYWRIVNFVSGACYANTTATHTQPVPPPPPPPPPPACTATAPSNVVITPIDNDSSRINWTPGSGGTGQRLYVGTNQAEVLAGCNGSSGGAACLVSIQLGAAASTYTVNTLQPGTVYYWRVVTYQNSGCFIGINPVADIASCSLSPSNLNLEVGDPAEPVTASVVSSSAIDRVVFRTNTTSIGLNGGAGGANYTDSSYPYSTNVRAISAGSGGITARVFINGVASAVCTAGTTGTGGTPPTDPSDPDGPDTPGDPGSPGTVVTSTAPNTIPWWQVKDGDVTATGNITSDVLSGEVFDDDGAGLFPGVPAFSGSINVSPGTISSTGWNANTQTVTDRTYNYSFFEDLVPGDITFANPATASLTTGGTAQDGYYWYKSSGSLTIGSNIDIGNRKVIVFVDGGDLNINGRINLNNGTGFFLAVVDGQIRVNASVTGAPSIEGIYVTDDGFSTGAGNSPLHIRGSVASYGAVNLQRDLDDDTPPAELLEFAADQLMLFPRSLSNKKTKWVEIAP